MQKSKIESLLGFAVKASKLIYGIDNIAIARKRLHIIIYDGSVSDNTQQRILEHGQKINTPILKSENLLETFLFKKNCKVAALIDKQMARAILDNINDNFQLIANGGKN